MTAPPLRSAPFTTQFALCGRPTHTLGSASDAPLRPALPSPFLDLYTPRTADIDSVVPSYFGPRPLDMGACARGDDGEEAAGDRAVDVDFKKSGSLFASIPAPRRVPFHLPIFCFSHEASFEDAFFFDVCDAAEGVGRARAIGAELAKRGWAATTDGDDDATGNHRPPPPPPSNPAPALADSIARQAAAFSANATPRLMAHLARVTEHVSSQIAARTGHNAGALVTLALPIPLLALFEGDAETASGVVEGGGGPSVPLTPMQYFVKMSRQRGARGGGPTAQSSLPWSLPIAPVSLIRAFSSIIEVALSSDDDVSALCDADSVRTMLAAVVRSPLAATGVTAVLSANGGAPPTDEWEVLHLRGSLQSPPRVAWRTQRPLLSLPVDVRVGGQRVRGGVRVDVLSALESDGDKPWAFELATSLAAAHGFDAIPTLLQGTAIALGAALADVVVAVAVADTAWLAAAAAANAMPPIALLGRAPLRKSISSACVPRTTLARKKAKYHPPPPDHTQQPWLEQLRTLPRSVPRDSQNCFSPSILTRSRLRR